MRRTFPAFARAAGRVVIGGAENGAAQSAGATKKRVRRKLRDPITITDRAADRIKELMQGHPDALGVRVGVQTRGCNGLSYTLNYATELQKFEDTVTDKGVTVVIEPKAIMHIVGTTMDFVEDELAAEFVFHNPNAKVRVPVCRALSARF
eukprot:INCI10028.2.p1 GENE.INCI10028.2~~INCI10028.2.p1  ORF type:complete len:150 (-),score=27.40 INCI10028.2:97-546(-)